jgi:signal peptidase II
VIVAPKTKAFAIMAVIWYVADQATKAAIRARLDVREQVEVIPGFFNLWRRHNPGAAFGMFGDHDYRILIFAVTTALAIAMVTWYMRMLPSTSRWMGAALGMIIAGALGNGTDRLFLGGEVTDFLDVYVGWEGVLQTFLVGRLGTSHWNTFNVADAALVIGVIMALIYVIFLERRQVREAASTAETAEGQQAS